MLALIPCIGPFIALLLGISFLNPVSVVAQVDPLARAGMTAFDALFLAAIF
ncbi:MAG TPA: hypothetical protein VED16_03390 [Candidatus Acidoferrum sp.]|nr:hypothetical protein [Candidatus Acidoferrum sp.]